MSERALLVLPLTITRRDVSPSEVFSGIRKVILSRLSSMTSKREAIVEADPVAMIFSWGTMEKPTPVSATSSPRAAEEGLVSNKTGEAPAAKWPWEAEPHPERAKQRRVK